MKTPQVSRPQFPPGYLLEQPQASVTWETVVQRLSESKNYWLASVCPDGRPHTIPRWGVFVENRFYYDGSPETRHARNLLENPRVSLHLESGDQALIVEGTARPAGKPERALAEKIAAAYCVKYTDFGYAPEPNQWDEGGLYVFTPQKVLTWTVFNEDPTKFVFTD